VLGAFIMVPAQQYFAYTFGASELYLVAYAAVFLIIMLFLPRGILPSIADRLRKRRATANAREDIIPAVDVAATEGTGVAQ
jgi:branched-chain amino acid transport system permease protein